MNPENPFTQLANYRRIEVFAAISAVLFLVLLIEAIRRRRLKERYALLWLATCAMVILLTLKRDWLESFSYMLGIYYAPSALFLVLMGFVIIILFHFSAEISRLLDDRTTLAQRIALLEERLSALEQPAPAAEPKAAKEKSAQETISPKTNEPDEPSVLK